MISSKIIYMLWNQKLDDDTECIYNFCSCQSFLNLCLYHWSLLWPYHMFVWCVIAFLWHKTDWGWLVLSWLLWSSHSLRAAGAGGGTDHRSRDWQDAAGKKDECPVQQGASGMLVALRIHIFNWWNQQICPFCVLAICEVLGPSPVHLSSTNAALR